MREASDQVSFFRQSDPSNSDFLKKVLCRFSLNSHRVEKGRFEALFHPQARSLRFDKSRGENSTFNSRDYSLRNPSERKFNTSKNQISGLQGPSSTQMIFLTKNENNPNFAKNRNQKLRLSSQESSILPHISFTLSKNLRPVLNSPSIDHSNNGEIDFKMSQNEFLQTNFNDFFPSKNKKRSIKYKTFQQPSTPLEVKNLNRNSMVQTLKSPSFLASKLLESKNEFGLTPLVSQQSISSISENFSNKIEKYARVFLRKARNELSQNLLNERVEVTVDQPRNTEERCTRTENPDLVDSLLQKGLLLESARKSTRRSLIESEKAKFILRFSLGEENDFQSPKKEKNRNGFEVDDFDSQDFSSEKDPSMVQTKLEVFDLESGMTKGYVLNFRHIYGIKHYLCPLIREPKEFYGGTFKPYEKVWLTLIDSLLSRKSIFESDSDIGYYTLILPSLCLSNFPILDSKQALKPKQAPVLSVLVKVLLDVEFYHLI